MPSLPDSDNLQFQTIEPATVTAAPLSKIQTCVNCKRPIQSTYFAVRDLIVCPNCAAMIKAGPPGVSAVRFAQALLFGLCAGLAGALIWYGVRLVMHAEIGLIAVLVGFMVGKAVRKGAGGRGGPAYQVLAIALTYACIAGNYMPDRLNAMSKHSASIGLPDLPHIVRAFWFCMKLPFLGGAENAIGLLIIGFALWEAWKLTKFTPVPITGPYQLSAVSKVIPLAPPYDAQSSGVII